MTMPIPLHVEHQRSFSGTRRRIYHLLADMGTSADAIWPFASQPFMRTPGPLEPGKTEEWHSGVNAVLDEVLPEERIVWRFRNEGFDGTHGFYLESDAKRTRLVHRIDATLSDTEGRLFWRRLEDVHGRTIEALFDKLERVLKR
ncbi:MAG: hypothetical protein WCE83_11225 [Candidatus Baltobacteraceae bacterium]